MEDLAQWGPWFAGVSLFISTATLVWTARKYKTEADTATVAMAKDAVELHRGVAEDALAERDAEIADLKRRLAEALEGVPPYDQY